MVYYFAIFYYISTAAKKKGKKKKAIIDSPMINNWKYCNKIKQDINEYVCI